MEHGRRAERVNEAWARLNGCMPILRAFVRRLARNEELADEVVQETCLRVFRADDAPPGESRFMAWCCGVARNVLLAERRKRSSRASDVLLDDDVYQPLDVRADPELRLHVSRELARASARLDDDGAELLVRRYVFGERIVDLAGERAQNPSALRMRLLRLRSTLRARKRR
jgi:RNA polymerase sigma factor (sigma-70 family)